jgi:hypothetical protein
MLQGLNGSLLLPFLSQESGLGSAISLLMYLSFILFIFFGQKIQLRMMLWEIDGVVRKLDHMRKRTRSLSLKTVKEIGKAKEDPEPILNTLLEQFVIQPVNMDPAGVVGKLEHIMDVRDSKFKDDVKLIAPEADETQVNNLENLIEAALVLNTIYRIVRHFYLLGKKTSSFYLILQLQMLLPLVMQEAEALVDASKAFAKGIPIGDGIGPYIVSKLMYNKPQKKIEKDVITAKIDIEGRKAIVLKAEGPGGNVGKPGEAIRRIVKANKKSISMIIMIDAALKFEGEPTGEVSEGIGAAIGGIGTERFKIEEEAKRFQIPLYAIIIKESIQEAITPMSKEITESSDEVHERIKTLILRRSKKGDSIIIAGIGNTIGIGQ